MSTKSFPSLVEGDLTLIPLSFDTQEKVRQWRNANRKWFFSQDYITPAQQQSWFRRYQDDLTCYFWVAHWNGIATGTGALAHLDFEKLEGEWSNAMVAENARGHGVAQRTCALIRDYGLDELKLERICGSLFTANEIMMHVDVSNGYLPYKVEGDVTFVELLRRDHR